MASPGVALLEKGTAAAHVVQMSCMEKKGAIAYVTVNRPKVLNALDTPTWKDTCEPPRRCAERRDGAWRHPDGAGNKAFIAGADISELANTTPRSKPNGLAAFGRRVCSTSSRISASR